MTVTIRPQPDAWPGDTHLRAWEMDLDGETYYIQETGTGIDHVLQKVGNESIWGWGFVERGRAEEVVKILLDNLALAT